MKNEVRYKILKKLDRYIAKFGAEYVGNNFNNFFSSSMIDKEIEKSTKKEKTARQEKSKLDAVRGKLFEDITVKLINSVFEADKTYNTIKAVKLNENKEIRKKIESIKIYAKGTNPYKTIDADVIVYSTEPLLNNRFFIISVKGTARERIGQFLSNLFIFDPNVIKIKYGNSVIFDSGGIDFKIAFLCYDLAKQRDLSSESKEKIKEKGQKGVKQAEVYLIDLDPTVSAGIYVPNNLFKLNKVGNFSSLIAKIKEFFTLPS